MHKAEKEKAGLDQARIPPKRGQPNKSPTEYVGANGAEQDHDGAGGVVDFEANYIEQWRGSPPKFGLALSGGGIRSASYALGVLQALALHRLLEKFDYLSTVSGGGFIGSSLTYLLHESAVTVELGSGKSPQFDVSADNFPYLSYPMVDAAGPPQGTPGPEERGRLLRRLRQNPNYLLPGNGITLLSLIGVILRNSLVSSLVHVILLGFLLQLFIGVTLLPTTGHASNGMFKLSGLMLCIFLAASAIYAPLTRVFNWMGQVWADRLYMIRRAYESWSRRLLGICIGSVLLGTIPVAHDFIAEGFSQPILQALAAKSGGSLPIVSIAFALLGIIGNIWSYLQLRGDKKPRIPVGAVVTLASLALLYGMLLLIFHFIVFLNVQNELTADPISAAATRFSAMLPAGIGSNVFPIGATGIVIGLVGVLRMLAAAHSGVKPEGIAKYILMLSSFILLAGIAVLGFDGILFIDAYVPGLGVHVAIYGMAVLVLLGLLPDVNYLSIHRYYRDRLMEAFMPDLDVLASSKERSGPSEKASWTMLGNVCGVGDADRSIGPKRGPYHIINANIVLVSSHHSRYRGRGGDNFILSPLYSGSRATGWMPTDVTSSEGLTLATAMAISGAAVSPNAAVAGEGLTRQPLLSALMGLFNIRLGYWHHNPAFYTAVPADPVSKRAHESLRAGSPWQTHPGVIHPGLLETFFRFNLKEDGNQFVLLTDGGHFENLGLYELVRRRLKVIVVSDASADPDYKFDDLANAIAKVRADFGTLIDITPEGLKALAPSSPGCSPCDKATGPVAERGYLIARIRYASRQTQNKPGEKEQPQEVPKESGVLIYLKSAFFDALSADLHGFRRAHPNYPNQPTSDQFFVEKEVDAYRELGFQTVRRLLKELDYLPAPEHELWEEAKRLLGISM